MQIKLADDWLFQRHSKETVKEWLRQLRYFYYVRAWGGHANDGDEFRVAFTYSDNQDLSQKIEQLGLAESITEKLGYTILFGHKFYFSFHNNAIQLHISGTKDNDPYEVSGEDLKACLALEKYFDNFGLQNSIDRSLEQNVCVISKRLYPELYP